MTTEAAEERTRESLPAVHSFLIADVRGYTHFTLQQGDAAAARLAALFAAIANDVVASFRGQLIEVRGDEILAAFASSRQALQAAVTLQARIAEAAGEQPALRVGIGLDAGEAIPVEDGFRGAALNLAARLCSLAAAGEILASETMTSLARKLEGIEYRERGLVQLKGFDAPVRVMEVTAEAPATVAAELEVAPQRERLPIGGYLGALPAGRITGREAELARAFELVESVQGGAGKLLLLVGEPGAGKTRLAQEITLQLRNRDFLIAAGRCYEPQQSVPYYPFVEALTSLYQVAPAAIQKLVPRRWAELGRLLPTLGLPVPETSAAADEQRLYWAVTGFVEALAAELPLALLLDDVHWADAASLDLLQHLTRHTGAARILLLATYRDVEVNRGHPLEAALRDLRREELVEKIEVRRLGQEATAGLIGAIMDQDVSADFADLVYCRTEGNPFFVQQVLRVLVERGDIYRKDGRWDRKEIEEIEVPESVRSVVGQRLSRLAEDTQEVLREASVLGQTFGFDELESMTGRSEAEIERALEEALAAGIVRENGRDTYGFDHALTQSAIYAELPTRRRRRLHLAAGEAIEALPERKRVGRAAELAWHFLEADDPERGLAWSLTAGDEAEGVYAHGDAEYHYRNALQVAEEEGDPALLPAIREKLGMVLRHRARLDEALATLQSAADTYREAGDLEGEMRVAAVVGRILFEQSRRDEGLRYLQPILERIEREEIATTGAIGLYLVFADLHWHGGQTDEALRLIERAAALAADSGADDMLGWVEERHGIILFELGRLDEAEAVLDRAIDILERQGDLDRLCVAYNNRHLVYVASGRPARAFDDLRRALEAARKLNNPIRIGWALKAFELPIWYAQGNWEAARPYAHEILNMRDTLRGTRSSSAILTALTQFEATGEDWAREDLEREVDLARRSHDHNFWGLAAATLSRIDILEGNPNRALQRIDAVLAEEALEAQNRWELKKWRAAALIDLGRLDEAAGIIEEAMSSWPRTEDANDWYWLLGQLHTAQGRYDEARAAFEWCLNWLADRPAVFSTALVQYDYGILLLRIGDITGARTRLEDSLSGFERLQAVAYAERSRNTLANISGP